MIVTDGAVDLPETLLASPLLRRVPGKVWVSDTPFAGDLHDFWAQLRKGKYPSTTPPSLNELVAAYEAPDPPIGLHVSRLLSVTLSRAEEAAARAGPGAVVVDTRSLSVGAGLVVAAVHQAALRSAPRSSIIDLARSLPERLHTFALVQEVEAVRRSDRAGLLPGSHLARNYPLVIAIRGRVVALAQPRRRGEAIDEVAEHVCRSVGGKVAAWALGHGDASDIDAVVANLSNVLGKPPHFSTSIDPTVGTHLGPDALVIGALSGPVDI